MLPEQLASDPAFRERFEREARTISHLDHPHICALHDVGHDNGVDFLVMRYLEGETLADRLRRGALPLDLALRYAMEIADALDKAHRAGIIHRDLKPGNIMLTKAGAKLLDFGLAKSGPPSAAGGGVSMLPTTPPGLTVQGTILGTFQYMAPEQLEGQEADARTDIFAFGAVLYEMLTGKKAFHGKSQASLIAAILEHEPQPVSTIQPLTPPALDRVIRIHCSSAHRGHHDCAGRSDGRTLRSPAATDRTRSHWRHTRRSTACGRRRSNCLRGTSEPDGDGVVARRTNARLQRRSG